MAKMSRAVKVVTALGYYRLLSAVVAGEMPYPLDALSLFEKAE